MKISVTRVQKLGRYPPKCPFRRACAVEWFGQNGLNLGRQSPQIGTWRLTNLYVEDFWQYVLNLGTRHDYRGAIKTYRIA